MAALSPLENREIVQKIAKITSELCAPWSEKISKALFAKAKESNSNEDIESPEENKPTETVSSLEEQAPKEGKVEEKQQLQEPTETTPSSEPQSEESSAPSTDSTTPSNNNNQADPDAIPERVISVEFMWSSFSDLFASLIKENAAEVIDTIMDSLVSKDCAISLLSSLLQHCKPPPNTNKMSKHEQIRSFLRQGLKKYIIKYSDDPREWGYYKDGVLCDVVEIDVTDEEEINWIFRDVTQNIENCTDLQQYIVAQYYIPLYKNKIRSIMYTPIDLTIDWSSIDYAAQDYAKAVYCIYHDNSGFVLEEIYRAFEAIATFETDDLVDAISFGISRVNIALQPGHDSSRKDFDIDEKNRTLSLRLCLEADEFAGIFRHKDLIPIIKVAGLYNTNYTKAYKFDLLSSASMIYKVSRGDIALFQSILDRKDFWYTANEKENRAIEGCKKYIDKYYKERLNPRYKEQSSSGGNEEGEGEEEDEEYERVIKGWHVIKFNRNSLHQERYLVLTNKAYWTFKFDLEKNKVDEKHFKRHDLSEFHVVDIGVLEETDKFTIEALKIFTREKRKKDWLGKKPVEIVTIQEGKPKKAKVSIELRKSLKVKQTTSEDINMFKNGGFNFAELEAQRPPRAKKPKPPRDRPTVEDCYSSVFIPYGAELSPVEIKEILQEIAWCVYAAAVSRQRARGCEPFMGQTLTVPKGGITSKIYNTLALGIGSKGKNKALKTATAGKAKGKKGATGKEDKEDDDPNAVQTFSPSFNKKPIKSILKKPQLVQPATLVFSAEASPNEKSPSTADNAPATEQPSTRRIKFRPEVQVFYHDTGDDDDGGDD